VKAYFDSSALVKRYVTEKGTDAVLAICGEADELGLSVIGYPEIISALCRLRREHKITGPQYLATKQVIARDLRDAVLCNVSESAVVQCILLLEENPLRALDAIHVAAALEWEADLFVSGDGNQIKAAKKAGLMVRTIL
jgi:predicted nucleic acid-binding protein